MRDQALTSAAADTILMVCGQTLVVSALCSEQSPLQDAVAIHLALTGDIKGDVNIRFSEADAKKVASAMMMGMPIEELDDMALSALAELGNMIMGGASSRLSEAGLATDISTPEIITEIMPSSDGTSFSLSNENMCFTLNISR